jgi:hypothetical protein
MTRSVKRHGVRLFVEEKRRAVKKNLNEFRKLAQSQTFGVSKRKIDPKGVINRRIIIDGQFGDYDYILHATKGWRRRYRGAQ